MNIRALVQVFAEFAPVFAFFFAGQILPFSQAVLVLVVFTIVSLQLSRYFLGKIPVLPLFSGLMVIITGGITVFLDIPDAIIVGDTLYYWLFAGLIVSGFYYKPHFLERIFGEMFALTNKGWVLLSARWLYVLVLAGFANEYVRIYMTPEFWVDYKFTKVILLTLFAVYQCRLARIYRKPQESNAWGFRTNNSN